MSEPEGNPFIAIPAALAGIYLVIVVLFLIFAPLQLGFLVSILWAFVVLGVFATFFAFLAKPKAKIEKKK